MDGMTGITLDDRYSREHGQLHLRRYCSVKLTYYG